MKNEIVNIYTEDCQTVITFEFKTQENYDKIASRALSCECPEFIIPMRFNENYDTTMVRYVVDKQYIKVEDIKEKLSIEKVLNLYEDFLNLLESCEDWYLKAEGFCYDVPYVYLDAKLEQFKLIYIPNRIRQFDPQGIKLIFTSLLEKCPEESGSTIQLQLYKYFYRPQFEVGQFKEMLNELKKNIVETKKVDVEPEKPQQQVKEVSSQVKTEEVKEAVAEEIAATAKVEETEEEEKNYRPTYAPRNRSQLSQEEIEEMVKSIYSGKSLDSQTTESPDEAEQKSDENGAEKSSFYSAKKEESKEEKGASVKPEATTSFYSRKSSSESKKEGEQEGKKASGHKRSLFESVFSGNKNNKGAGNGMHEARGTRLQSISTPARYDLPPQINLDFSRGAFVIGRKSREETEEKADFEFGLEITPISRMHAKIEKKSDGYYLTDLGSSNGTFINGNKINANESYLISEGDKVAFAIAFSKNSIEYEFHE